MYSVLSVNVKTYLIKGTGTSDHLEVNILEHDKYPAEKLARLNSGALVSLAEAREIVKILERENEVGES